MIAQDRPVATGSEAEQESAFELLYLQTRGDLLAYLHRRTDGGGAGAAEAADLLAQVYLVAWRRREVAPPAGQQRPWLFGIARLVLAEHHRTSRVHARLQEVTDEVTGQVIGSHAGTGEDDRTSARAVSSRDAAVRRALEDLGDLDRELLLLTVWDGLSCGEAAAALGISAGTARVRLHRARHRLRGHEGLLGLLSDKA